MHAIEPRDPTDTDEPAEEPPDPADKDSDDRAKAEEYYRNWS